MKALIVEDSTEVIESIETCLAVPWPNIEVVATSSGRDAIHLAEELAPDIVLLDLTLPDVYGLHVLKEIRRFSTSPIIIITANGEETTRLASFGMGTDDYLVKPISHLDLLSSVKAALNGKPDGNGQSPGLIVDLPGRRLVLGGSEVKLTPAEWRLLTFLVRNHGRVVPYAALGDKPDSKSQSQHDTIRKRFRRLAAKLGTGPKSSRPVLLDQDGGFSLRLFPAPAD